MLTFEPESNILRNYGLKPSIMVGQLDEAQQSSAAADAEEEVRKLDE